MPAGAEGAAGLAAAREVRLLDLQLVRVRLRFALLGSEVYLEEEGKLVELTADTLAGLVRESPWMRLHAEARVLALAACADLIEAWRSGKLYRFTRRYLWRALLNHVGGRDKNETLNMLAEPRAPGHRDVLQEVIARENRGQAEALGNLARRQAEHARAGLSDEERRLFDAWVASAGQRGWQTRHSVAEGHSPAWVTSRLERLRERLRGAFGIDRPDELVALLQSWQSAASSEQPPEDEPAESPTASLLDADAQQTELTKAFQDQPLALAAIAAYRTGLTEDEVLQHHFGLVPDATAAERTEKRACLEEVLLDIHGAYVHLAEAFWRGDEARRFFERIRQGKASVHRVVDGVRLTWPAERVALVRRVQELARAGVSFAALPGRLGISATDAGALVLEIKKLLAAAQPTDQRRSP